FLHAGGAIGADGQVAGIGVHLPPALAGFRLPPPPAGGELAAAVRASLDAFDTLGPARVLAPALGAAYRAVLGPSDFTVWVVGPTGSFKTELAAIGQQHFGAGLDARNLPGNWSSTSNALEGIAFAAKDVLLTVDDFVPGGGAVDVHRAHQAA